MMRKETTTTVKVSPTIHQTQAILTPIHQANQSIPTAARRMMSIKNSLVIQMQPPSIKKLNKKITV